MPAEAFRAAISFHQQGRLREAERLYQAVLEADRHHFGALNNLGLIRSQQGHVEDAIRLIRNALKQNPSSAEAHNSLGNVLQAVNRVEEAIVSFEKALAINPDFAMAHYNLGNALQALNRDEAAIVHYEKALAIKPDYIEARYNLGNALRALNRPEEAIAHYQKVLAIKPNFAEAHNNLGNALQALNRHEEAITFFEATVAIMPELALAHYNLGNTLQALNRHEEAIARYEQALVIKSDLAEAHNNIGTALQALNRHEEAIASYEQALASKSDYADAHNNLGNALRALNRHEEAIARYEQALVIKPNLAETHNNLGIVLQALNRHEEAIARYEQALVIKPDFADAHNNLGNALQALNRYREAIARYEQALVIKPDLAEAHNNVGTALHALNRYRAAIARYEQALVIKPDYADAHNNLGNALQALNRHEEAIAHYEQALLIKPDYAFAHSNLGLALQELGRLEEAQASFKAALALKSDDPAIRIQATMAELPILYETEVEIAERRQRYDKSLASLEQFFATIALDRHCAAECVGVSQPFLLAYQGFPDRDLQRRYGAMVSAIMAKAVPDAAGPLAPSELAPEQPIRVGVVCGHFMNHSAWKGCSHMIMGLDRRRFQLFGYHTSARRTQETASIEKRFDRFVQGPFSPVQWCATIRADQPHVLIYPELGMDPEAPKLAALRLAPVQCLWWGHPETSGLATMDYFLSSDLMEPPDAEYHYTEQLVRLPHLGTAYRPPAAEPLSLARADLGIRPDAAAYWCCQSLFKYLPQHDVVFPRIAECVAGAQFVFISSRHSNHVTERFKARITRAFAARSLDAERHIVILPRLDYASFIAAAGCCDVFLDSIGWSGFNTALDSLVHDLPIVTWPGTLMRSRHSYAVLRLLGINETIADSLDSYVDIAARLGLDHDWRMSLRARTAAAKSRVMDDEAPTKALEAWIEKVVLTQC